MRRPLALLVPLAVVLALVGVALAPGVAGQTVPDGQVPFVASHPNGTNYMTIPSQEVATADSATPGMDAGLALGIDGRDLHTEHRMETFRQRFDGAGSDADRIAAYQSIVTDLEDRADALRERNDVRVESYGAGDATARTFLRERAVIAAEAGRLQGTISELRAIESETIGFELDGSLTTRLRVLDGRLDWFRGSVSEDVAGIAGGNDGRQRVYVEGSRTGYVAATVDGDTYRREAYLADEYEPSAQDSFQTANGSRLENARQRGLALYPSTTAASTEPFGSTYRYNGLFEDGQLTVFLDGGTGNAFREDQRLNVTTLRPSAFEQQSNGTVALRVNRTFPTGPMEVTLSDATTGEPINGTVTVGGQAVGTTGDDGALWTVEPRGDTTVLANTPEANVSVGLVGTDPEVEEG